MGLCFGAWGEASQDIHNRVEILARARPKFQVLQEGRHDMTVGLAMIIDYDSDKETTTVSHSIAIKALNIFFYQF